MSKLDDVLDSYVSVTDSRLVTKAWTKRHKQQIKDLVLSLKKEAEKVTFGKVEDKWSKFEQLLNEL